MTNFPYLVLGEVKRMQKYHIIGANVLVAIILVAILHFTGIENVDTIFPLLLFIDGTLMSMLMVGVTMFFEKGEGTLRTMLITPISKYEYIFSKVISNILSILLSILILYGYAWYFKDLSISFFLLLAVIVLIAFFHSLLGFYIMYFTKDFTSLLMWIMTYGFIITIPVLLNELGIWTGKWVNKSLLILPTKASSTLLFAVTSLTKTGETYFSIIYLIIGSILLLYLVQLKFNEFAAKESGV